MRRILISQKTFGITKETSLTELKKIYRNLMKEWHPDTIQNDAEKLLESEIRSKEIIEAYQFLVSINPETHAANIEEYTELTTEAAIENWEYKGITLKFYFQNGSIYEYLGVPKNVYMKMINSGTTGRFARRHIFHSYPYRKAAKEKELV
jgi:curved DNA-binding protein CbpA